MTSTASAGDFSAWFDTDTGEQSNPERGTVAIDTERLTLKSTAAEITVPLSAITDVRVEHIPRTLGPIPPGQVPITVTYDDGGDVAAAAIAANGDVIRPLTMQILETRLTGAPIRVRHPAQLGQESPSASFTRGTLTPADGVIDFETNNGGRLDTSNIISFERTQSNSGRHVVAVTFVRQGTRCRTDIQMTNERTVSLFGRYLAIQTELNTS